MWAVFNLKGIYMVIRLSLIKYFFLVFTFLLLLVCNRGTGTNTDPGEISYTAIKIGKNYRAFGLNNFEHVVGWDQTTLSTPFLWTVENGFTFFNGYVARSINDSGHIAGKISMYQAGVYIDGQWITLPGRQDAEAINTNGQVTGLISSQPGPYLPYKDNDISTPDFITLQIPWECISHSFDINCNGEIVGYCSALKQVKTHYATYWGPDTNRILLQDNDVRSAMAYSINNYQEIVGTVLTDSGSTYAAYWESPTAVMQALDSLEGEGRTRARAINNVSEIVGSSAGKACLWTKEKKLIDLNLHINPPLGVTVTEATDINDNGSITANCYQSNDEPGAYLLIRR